MSNNPFQAPQPNEAYGQPGFPPGKSQHYGRAYVQQIAVIAALMIVQGVLLLLFAVFMCGYAFLFNQIDSLLPADQQAEFRDQFPAEQGMIFSVMFGVFGIAGFLLSIMHFMSAYFGFTYKYRAFGITTMILGLGSMMTCYCAPTAIGLAVYGMIIYFNPAVAQAFAMAKSGRTKQEILKQFPR